MQSWTEFKMAEPHLNHIEEVFAQLEAFEEYYKPEYSDVHGLAVEDIEEIRAEALHLLRKHASKLTGEVYYWLLPFYKGCFPVLLRAMRRIGAPDPERQTTASRRAFYRFFLSLPFAERVVLGLKLDDFELMRNSEALRGKINHQKQNLTEELNQLYGN